MKILYIAKHNQVNSNDDEGSIAYALEKLGHTVYRYNEVGVLKDWSYVGDADFCLFHKWDNPEVLKRIACPKVFWYFDLVNWPSDPSIKARCDARRAWMERTIPLVDVGFCTDGDWVKRVGASLGPPLYTLRQGADERVVGVNTTVEKNTDVLFIGQWKNCGRQRESFVADLRAFCIGKNLSLQIVPTGVYREQLRNLVWRSKVVVCPDSPVTDRYWSNRVYIMAGFGGCVLHPFVGHVPAIYYDTRSSLFGMIEDYLRDDAMRERVSLYYYTQATAGDLYRHRCEELIRVVRERGVVR